ncbi:phosphoribosyltransferase [Phycicoccus sp. CSK15P-2]|uniref:phosphoribosyltransferase n=1 Tax=Phycicoccus sp. CSK15P-2 TaxID=2807627 RepID=UPI001950B004|nr:phosphoribosyltransferase family protein [Phycicoccus sp. CSK15P-2]MBM6404738.1 phosphoribosyltransferase [Phycicoccus sp. CSK15P-2]
METEREVLTWQAFGDAVRDLAALVAVDGVPDAVLSIARGGLLVGGALGYSLGVKTTYTLNVELYTGVDERLGEPQVLAPVPDLADLHDADVLLADDVADTGLTLQCVQAFCSGRVGRLRTAVVYEKPRSVVRPEYAWRSTDRWVTFPWSALDPVTAATGAGPAAAVPAVPEAVADTGRL